MKTRSHVDLIESVLGEGRVLCEWRWLNQVAAEEGEVWSNEGPVTPESVSTKYIHHNVTTACRAG